MFGRVYVSRFPFINAASLSPAVILPTTSEKIDRFEIPIKRRLYLMLSWMKLKLIQPLSANKV
ncbi:MAG: hypothetical protein B6D39_11745 [Anaerolineae bacterium UTCFX2]|jgi:hypothetical protein|nr:MAG: hypothetical protein B6D39_11745 [Anaerolineae bacterium UTCFX2]